MTRVLPTVCLLVSVAAAAQQPMVLLDPARGGSAGGGRIADRTEEKQVTLQTALRLAALLRARGFAVEMTRDADVDVTNDARAALANTTHPIACVLLHASSGGRGVHLYTTSMKQTNADPAAPALWDEAQAAYADRSHAMRDELVTAFGRSKLPVSVDTSWLRPLDNMQCPAVAVEVSPLKDGTGAEDPSYQVKVADVIAGAMIFWRGKVGSMMPPPPAPSAPAAPAGASTPVAGPSVVARPATTKPVATPVPAPKPVAPSVPTPKPVAPSVPTPKPVQPARSNP